MNESISCTIRVTAGV